MEVATVTAEAAPSVLAEAAVAELEATEVVEAVEATEVEVDIDPSSLCIFQIK